MPSKTFSHPINITLHDIDAAGVMFFADYFRHAHDAYECFMAEIGFPLPQLIHQRTLLPLVHSEADFLLPVHHGDRLRIEIHLERIGTSSFTVGYQFLDTQAREVARIKTTHVLLHPGKRSPMGLPKTLLKSLDVYAVSTDG